MPLTDDQKNAIKYAVCGGVMLLDHRCPLWRKKLADAMTRDGGVEWAEEGGIDVLATVYGVGCEEGRDLMFPCIRREAQEERARRYGFALPLACTTEGTNHAEACYAFTQQWLGHVEGERHIH